MQGEGRPVFIVGSGRSGSSVLTWCLGQHPNIMPLPETHWITRLALRMREIYGLGAVHGRYSHLSALDWDEAGFFAAFGRAVDQFVVDTREPRLRYVRKLSMELLGLDEGEVARMEKEGRLSPDPDLVTAENYQLVRSADDPKRRWVDGAPENTFYMYGLALLFPGAKFIHVLRDPHAVARSLMGFSRAGGAGRDHGEAEAYERWHRAVDYAVKGEKAFGAEKVMRMDYDRLVEAPEETLRACLAFLGEDFTPDCLLPLQEKINSSHEKTADSRFTPKTRQGRVAADFYQSVKETPPGAPDKKALEELKRHFEQYADKINAE